MNFDLTGGRCVVSTYYLGAPIAFPHNSAEELMGDESMELLVVTFAPMGN